jgi:hypothetical protein
MREGFAPRFRLALQALSISRGRAAQLLGVDKSLVGRWASGAVRPTEQNLAKVTELVARKYPFFTMLHWDQDFIAFAELLGADPSLYRQTSEDGKQPSLSLSCFSHALAETERRGSAYHGFWRSVRPSVIMPGKLFCGYGMFRAAPNGFLQIRVGSSGLIFDGWGFVSEGNFAAFVSDNVGCSPLSFMFKGVPLPKAMMLDGLLLLAAFDAGRTPAAVPVILERIGDLSGNERADDETCDELVSRSAELDTDLPENVRLRLLRDIGPTAAAAGGDMFLTASGEVSRGMSALGDLEG